MKVLRCPRRSPGAGLQATAASRIERAGVQMPAPSFLAAPPTPPRATQKVVAQAPLSLIPTTHSFQIKQALEAIRSLGTGAGEQPAAAAASAGLSLITPGASAAPGRAGGRRL